MHCTLNRLNVTCMHLEAKKNVFLFMALFALLWWSGSESTISLRYTCKIFKPCNNIDLPFYP